MGGDADLISVIHSGIGPEEAGAGGHRGPAGFDRSALPQRTLSIQAFALLRLRRALCKPQPRTTGSLSQHAAIKLIRRLAFDA